MNHKDYPLIHHYEALAHTVYKEKVTLYLLKPHDIKSLKMKNFQFTCRGSVAERKTKQGEPVTMFTFESMFSIN